MKRQNKNEPKKLTPDTWLIRLDCVEPGQVLLTRGGGLLSNAIVAFSGGRFSHAAVFVTAMHALESYEMISCVLLEPVGFERVGAEVQMLAQLPHDPQDAALFYHSEIANAGARFGAAYNRVMEEYHGRDYSSYWRLVSIAQIQKTVRQVAVGVTRCLDDWWLSPSPVEGPFCSELVAEFFSELELPLLQTPKPPHEVTPNDLAVSNLRPVRNALVKRKDVRKFMRIKARAFWTWGRKQQQLSTTLGNQIRRIGAGLGEAENGLKDLVKSEQASLRPALREQAESLEMLLKAVQYDRPSFLQEQVARLCVRFIVISSQLLAPLIFDKAFVRERNEAILQRYDIQCSYIRCITLFACGQNQVDEKTRKKLLADGKKAIAMERAGRRKAEKMQKDIIRKLSPKIPTSKVRKRKPQ